METQARGQRLRTRTSSSSSTPTTPTLPIRRRSPFVPASRTSPPDASSRRLR
jgi:hypothetical protein